MADKIVNDIINGYKITKSIVMSTLYDLDTETLCDGANTLREHFCDNKASLCSIISGKTGHCSEDCKFCAQSANNSSCIEKTDFVPLKKILEDAKYHFERGVHRYSIVTVGKALSDDDFEKAIKAYDAIKKYCNINLCASHGLLDYDHFMRLKEAGVTRYHCNLETSERYFKDICSTHTYEDKINTIKSAKKAGLEICSGGIIGMGETMEDRIDMAFTLSNLEVNSIPINVLIPIKGTKMENQTSLSHEEILRTIALFRYINPSAEIRLAAGRISMNDFGKSAFLSGANATITGDMLTTNGTNIEYDKRLLQNIGYYL